MPTGFHHVALFVNDMDESLNLFSEVLGMNLLWRRNPTEDVQLARFLGLPQESVKAEIAYLQLTDGLQGLELISLHNSGREPANAQLGAAGSLGLSFITEDMDGLSHSMEAAGCRPCTEELTVATPDGSAVTVRGFQTPDGALVELIGPGPSG